MANKFKKGFVSEYNDNREKEAETNQLKKKHHITDENVIIVEKSNTIKFMIRVILLIIKTAAWIALVTLAAVGILCLIFPDTRTALQADIALIFTGTMNLIKQ